MKIINIVFLLNLFFLNKNLSCCIKCSKRTITNTIENGDNNNSEDDNYKEDKVKEDNVIEKVKKEDDNKINDDIFEKCLNFKDDLDFKNEYKPINSGFKWENNNCWIISSIEFYLNNPKNQNYLKNKKFDKNNIEHRKNIVLQDILKLFYNNEGNYNLDFSKYYEFFWSEMKRKSSVGILDKKYGFCSAHSILNLLGTEDFCRQFDTNFIYMLSNEDIKKNNNFNEVKNMYYNYLLKNDFFSFFLINIFGEKYKNFLFKCKDNLIIEQNGSFEPNINNQICNKTFLYIYCKTKNIKKKITEIIKKLGNNYIDHNGILKDYNIELFSIIFSAPEYHFFTFNYDKINKKLINLNSYNDKEKGKIYNPIDLLNNDLEITQDGDTNKYYPDAISIYISDKNEDIDKYDLQRFIDAQKNDYIKALNEVKNGHKESHWVWYIFPQIDGLGNSEMNKKYSIKSEEEGLEYLKNDILRENLIEITKALLQYYEKDKTKKIEQIFENPDNLKLQSSMTLFNYIIEKYKNSELKEIYNEFLNENNKVIFKEILDVYYNSKECEKSLDIVNNKKM